MHTFIIHVLILNTPIFVVHLDTRIMVISYTKFVYFKIQCKNSRNKITIHLLIFYILKNSHNNINMKITP